MTVRIWVNDQPYEVDENAIIVLDVLCLGNASGPDKYYEIQREEICATENGQEFRQWLPVKDKSAFVTSGQRYRFTYCGLAGDEKQC